MPAYLQMGHNSEKFIKDGELPGFTGIILSPVNRTPQDLQESVSIFREKADYDIIFDPQLYCPKFDRGQLPTHHYFPKDLDTADSTSNAWWKKIIGHLVTEVKTAEVNAVCSPAMLPKKYTSDYYSNIADIYSILVDSLGKTDIRPIMTLCVSLKELEKIDDALNIASIVTRNHPRFVYLVIESDTEPRREIADQNLLAIMALISSLETNGCQTLVSHCSSEMVLMKVAGASHCASGNFFNLRRFTRSRFDEQQDEGGRQIAYWFEHSLMAFLRRADITRIHQKLPSGSIGAIHSGNEFAKKILTQFEEEPTKAWVALGWRQYLSWFAATESNLSNSDAILTVNTWLKETEKLWKQVEDKDVLMDEPRNDGSWIRPWRQILIEFGKYKNSLD